MSKSKENATETVDEGLATSEVKETEVTSTSETQKEAKTKETETTSSGKKNRMGLTRFLQLEPQKRGIEAILMRKYVLEVMTQTEWERTVENVCSRSVR